MKKIISARRQNGQAVFYTSKHNPITEFQALAFDFNVCNEPEKSGQETINLIKKDYSGLSDWKIEDVKE